VGVTSGYGVSSHFDVVIPTAGGSAKVPGDYVYRTWTADQFQVGFWGLFRVAPSAASGVFADTVGITQVAAGDGGKFVVSGFVTVRPGRTPPERNYASEVQLMVDGKAMTAKVDQYGRWDMPLEGQPARIEAISPYGGMASWSGAAPQRVAAFAVLRTQRQLEPVRPRARVQGRRRVGPLP
jgi:hypothetical protein